MQPELFNTKLKPYLEKVPFDMDEQDGLLIDVIFETKVQLILKMNYLIINIFRNLTFKLKLNFYFCLVKPNLLRFYH